MEAIKDIFSSPLKTAYYARVSTDYESQQNSLENQKTYFENYIKLNKNWVFSGGYVDEGISGTDTKKRTSFLKMIDDALRGKIDLIVTKEISRFSRNTIDSIKYTRLLLQNNVGVYFLSDNINTFMPDSELRLTIMSALAQEEIRKLSERVKFGLNKSIQDGKVLGSGDIYGYTKKDGKLFVDDEGARVVKKIFFMYASGNMGIRTIAKMLENEGIVNKYGKMLTHSTITSIIRNPKYKGFYCGKKYFSKGFNYGKKLRTNKEDWLTYKDNQVPKIIDEAVWDKANAILSQRGEICEKNTQNRYPYSGKIICGIDNATYHRFLSGKNKKEAWCCKIYKIYGKQKCPNKIVYSKDIDFLLLKQFNAMINKDNIISCANEIYKGIQTKSSDTSSLKKEINKLILKKDAVLELYSQKLIDKNEFFSRFKAINDKIEILQKHQNLLSTNNHLNNYLEFLNAILSNPSSRILTKIFKTAIVYENKITIDYLQNI